MTPWCLCISPALGTAPPAAPQARPSPDRWHWAAQWPPQPVQVHEAWWSEQAGEGRPPAWLGAVPHKGQRRWVTRVGVT